MVFGYGLRLIAQHFAVTRQTSKLGIIRRWTLPVSEIPVLWRFSLPAMLNSLLGGPATWCAISIIAHQTNGHAEVGVFNAANQWFSLLQFLPTIMTQVSFPILTERLNAGAANAAWKLFCGQILVTIGIVTVAVIVVILMSPFIMGFYGFQYADKWPILIAVAIASWFAAPQGPMGNLIIAHEMPWSWFVDSVLWAGCLIVVVCIFRSRGAIALAWGHVAAYAVRGLFASVQVHQLRTNTNKQ
jgi:O-antigen/teichoic acid export membrane protein